jgi:DNA sulfur modification protein DndB
VTSNKQIGTKASYPALRLKQNDQIFYFSTIPVEEIFPFCFVARRQEDPIEGFQRNLSDQRALDIADYLDNSVGSIPTNIVLSAQDSAELEYDSRTKSLKYRRVPKAFLVLDGQHRLYGYGQTKKKHRIPVAIYENLSRKEEAALFIDINTNQRGVPAALLLDIKQVAERESQNERTLRLFFDKLQQDHLSPYCGLLSPSTSARGKISRVTFNRGIAIILESQIMNKLSQEKQYELIRNFFIASEEALRKPELLIRSTYFESFCGLFDDATRISRTKFQNYKLESLKGVLAPINNVDLEALVTGGKSKVTKSTIITVLKQAISGQFEISEDMI